MHDYNQYVTAINKIFDLLAKMKAGWNSQDNFSYIEKVESFQNMVTTTAEVFKQPAGQVVQQNAEETPVAEQQPAQAPQPETAPAPVQQAEKTPEQTNTAPSTAEQPAQAPQPQVSGPIPSIVSAPPASSQESQPQTQEAPAIPIPTIQ